MPGFSDDLALLRVLFLNLFRVDGNEIVTREKSSNASLFLECSPPVQSRSVSLLTRTPSTKQEM